MTETLLTAILALIINGLIIIGVHRSTRDGMIFGFVERWWVRENPEYKTWLKKFGETPIDDEGIWEFAETKPDQYCVSFVGHPLTECPVCMPSVWGALGFAGFYLPFIPIEYAWAAVPYVLALCGLMWISRSLWMEVEE